MVSRLILVKSSVSQKSVHPLIYFSTCTRQNVSSSVTVLPVIPQTGNTALHLCAVLNHSDTADQLLRHGVDLSLKNKVRTLQLHLVHYILHPHSKKNIYLQKRTLSSGFSFISVDFLRCYYSGLTVFMYNKQVLICAFIFKRVDSG